eukprot:jgi/Chrzof1/327/Cz01g11160.t1
MLPVQDDFSFGDVMALGGLGLGCAAASACLWYYSRRYVGELSLLPPNRCVARFSVLDFWGNREDVDVPVARIQPPFQDLRPKQIDKLCNQRLFPVNVEGDRQYYLSIPAGHILDKERLLKILQGTYQQDCAATRDGVHDDPITQHDTVTKQQHNEQ